MQKIFVEHIANIIVTRLDYLYAIELNDDQIVELKDSIIGYKDEDYYKATNKLMEEVRSKLIQFGLSEKISIIEAKKWSE